MKYLLFLIALLMSSCEEKTPIRPDPSNGISRIEFPDATCFFIERSIVMNTGGGTVASISCIKKDVKSLK